MPLFSRAQQDCCKETVELGLDEKEQQIVCRRRAIECCWRNSISDIQQKYEMILYTILCS